MNLAFTLFLLLGASPSASSQARTPPQDGGESADGRSNAKPEQEPDNDRYWELTVLLAGSMLGVGASFAGSLLARNRAHGEALDGLRREAIILLYGTLCRVRSELHGGVHSPRPEDGDPPPSKQAWAAQGAYSNAVIGSALLVEPELLDLVENLRRLSWRALNNADVARQRDGVADDRDRWVKAGEFEEQFEKEFPRVRDKLGDAIRVPLPRKSSWLRKLQKLQSLPKLKGEADSDG